ncbi:MFS transporter [Burkholderia vietnamiensis]|uniref:MFS transporter n=1 Tax=Burkholderia vietnamiensis TaxID=60552 RepID=A0AAW7SYA6_BURVI|nr:MFS transporter [Burkholderia vietnamiensis]MBH9645833.1 MFS transporter [Burkholderia vietnamiensis]MBR8010532.1 MFS transporter [Burkholderia vietnamiensis]MDN7551286.1 MFS transporter [Burkholderia vietnamiensis]MDN7795100.1 MFS transporter [Burkholderia vietnamiensis]MDN8043612.1 MFS transporter [Burkholderia vietnamiensis]
MKTTLRERHSAGAFFVLIAAFAINMSGTTLPTAIYGHYQHHYGLTSTVVSTIYAAYAAGVLGALLTVGNWSDQLGRRRMLLAGLSASVLSSVVFLLSDGVAALMLARFLSGVSAGIFTGTASVAVIEATPAAWRPHAILAATASNMLGLGCGPLLGGVLVEWLPWPMRLPYAVHLLLASGAAVGVFTVPETAQVPARAKLGLQRISLPDAVRPVFVPAALAGFAGFVVVGFFAAVAPQLIRDVLGLRNGVVIGAIVFLLFACSALGQTMQARIEEHWRMPAGCAALVAGLLGIALCVLEKSLGVLLIGTALAGVGQGISLRSALSGIAVASPPDRRAAVTSLFFVVLYVAISLPVIGLGAAVQHVGIERASLIFAVATIALVLSALVIALIQRAGWRLRSAADGEHAGQRE